MSTATITVHGPEETTELLYGLARVSLLQIRRGLIKAPLYKSGVVYQREPLGREIWQPAWETQLRKNGDCEDLVAWRVAELWASGESKARPHCYSPRPGLIHCVVRRANGKLEDPSKKLGMGKSVRGW